MHRWHVLLAALAALFAGPIGCPSSEDRGDRRERDDTETEDEEREEPREKAPAKSEPRDTDRERAEEPERPALDPTLEASAQHVLVRYAGSKRAGPEITRTKEEARTRAELVVKKARGGGDFDALVAEYSEEPRAAERKGRLGVFRPGQMVPEFDRAVFAMEVGAVSDVVETPFGFHVIKRLPIERISAHHILVMHKESMRVPPNVTRTKQEARTRAEEVLRKARRKNADFTALAREYTDEPQRPGATPGDLGRFERGRMVPAFEEAAFALDPGEISGLVETPFGYHVIKRIE